MPCAAFAIHPVVADELASISFPCEISYDCSIIESDAREFRHHCV